MKKKFLLLLPVIALMGMAIMVKPVNFTIARAEDGVSEVASEEAPSEEETNAVDGVLAKGEGAIEEIKNFKDTFLVPLLSGVSIFSLVTTAISITLAVLNKKSNGQVRAKAMEIIEKATDVVNVANKIKESAQAQYEETKALALEVKGKAQELIESGKKTQEEVKRLYNLKDSMVCLLEVEAKKLANEGNAVASGLAEDVNKLVNDLKDLIK